MKNGNVIQLMQRAGLVEKLNIRDMPELECGVNDDSTLFVDTLRFRRHYHAHLAGETTSEDFTSYLVDYMNTYRVGLKRLMKNYRKIESWYNANIELKYNEQF